MEVSSFFEAHPHLEDNNEFRPEEARGAGQGVLQRARTLHFALPLSYKAINDSATFEEIDDPNKKEIKSNHGNDFRLPRFQRSKY